MVQNTFTHLHQKCEVADEFCTSANQYVNSCNEICTLVECFLTYIFFFWMLFLAQTQVHNDNGLNLLLRVLNAVFHLQMTSFAHSPFCTTYLCDIWSKSNLCICRGNSGHSSEITEVWPIRRASLSAYQQGEKKKNFRDL